MNFFIRGRRLEVKKGSVFGTQASPQNDGDGSAGLFTDGRLRICPGDRPLFTSLANLYLLSKLNDRDGLHTDGRTSKALIDDYN